MFEYKIEQINTRQDKATEDRGAADGPWSGWLGAGLRRAGFRRRAHPEGLSEAAPLATAPKPNRGGSDGRRHLDG